MINLRYHIVSITAVFLALGIGLVFGASFIDRATVNQLERNLTAIEEENSRLADENAELEARVAAASEIEAELREQGLAQLVAGRLEDVPVLVVAVRGVDEDAVDGLVAALEAAGAEHAGVLWLTERLLLDDEGEVTDLADSLQLAVDDPFRLQASLARRLGAVLADAAQPVVEDPPAPGEPVDGQTPADPGLPEEDEDPVEDPEPVPEPELLGALRAAEFIELEPPGEPPAGFAVVPEAGLRVVVVAGPGAVLPFDRVLLPLLGRLTEDAVARVGGPVTVAVQAGDDGADDAAASRVMFVGPLRDNETLRARMSTVDDIDLFSGLVATVLALEHGAAGQFGHYGLGDGAQSLLPPPVSPEGG